MCACVSACTRSLIRVIVGDCVSSAKCAKSDAELTSSSDVTKKKDWKEIKGKRSPEVRAEGKGRRGANGRVGGVREWGGRGREEGGRHTGRK